MRRNRIPYGGRYEVEDRREPPEVVYDDSDVPAEDPEWWDCHDGDDELDENGRHWWENK